MGTFSSLENEHRTSGADSMGYGLRYYKEIPQQGGGCIRLEIYKKGSTAAAMEIGAVLRTLALEVQGQQDDIDAPIVKTSLTMSFVDAYDLENGKKNGFWEEFYSPDAVMWKIIVLAKDAKENAFREVWGGYVTPDSFSESLTYRGDVTIIARDNIGHLQDFPFDAEGDADGMISLYDLINAGWEKIESPMQLDWAAAEMWLQTDGVSARDTLLNVSAFADKNWYEVLDNVLYSYGAVMRYVGDSIVHICPLRYLPNQGFASMEIVPRNEPVFSAGAERELIPAAKRIEERAEYELESLVFEKLPNSAYTGEIERFQIEGNSVDLDGIAYSVSKKTSGEGWCCPHLSMFFDASQYEFYNNEDADKAYNFLVCNEYGGEGVFTYGRYAEYSRSFYSKSVLFEMRFGQPYAFTQAGQLRQWYALENVTIAVIAEKNGVTSFLQQDGTWATDSAAIVLPADNLSLAIPISDFNGGVLLKIQIHHIKTTGAAKSVANYIPLYNASLSPLDAMRESNSVNTNYNEGNNVTFSREPKIAPAYDVVALPAFIKNGIFYRSGDAILPARSWSWTGGIPQQMAVYNHLQVLAYYAKPFNLISGTILNADITRAAAVYVWKGAEHILLSGRYNFLTGQIEGAMLREFYRYDDLWGDLQGTIPAVDEGSRSNVEGGAAGATNASTYTSTTSVNIGMTGSGGGASTLHDLTDVNVEDAAVGSILYFNGTEWIDKNLQSLLTDFVRNEDLAKMWRIENGRLVTDMNVLGKGSIFAMGELGGGAAGAESGTGTGTGIGGYRVFTYQQSQPSEKWEITHRLGKMPNVKVIDSTGALVHGSVVYDKNDILNKLTISFEGGFSGTAYLD